MKPIHIAKARDLLDMTQKELGKALRLPGATPDRTVRGWENGETAIPGPVSLAMAYVMQNAQSKILDTIREKIHSGPMPGEIDMKFLKSPAKLKQEAQQVTDMRSKLIKMNSLERAILR